MVVKWGGWRMYRNDSKQTWTKIEPQAKTHWTNTIKHTVPAWGSPVLPRSQLSHRRAGNSSCPITGDTVVKLSNKSASGGRQCSPCWLCDHLEEWLLPSQLPRLQLGLRYPAVRPGRGPHIYGGWLSASMQVREKRLVYRNTATFSGLNICGVINIKWILASI